MTTLTPPVARARASVATPAHDQANRPLAALRGLLGLGALILIGVWLAGCGGHHEHAHGHAHAAAPAEAPPSNRIPIPAQVRANLGITFAVAEYRPVVATRRFPGRFEPDADARQAYPAPITGQLEWLVRPYQVVTPGQPLYRLRGQAWTEQQRIWREAQLPLPGFEPAVAAERVALVRRSLAQMSGLGSDDPRLDALAEGDALTVHARAPGAVEGTLLATGALVDSGEPLLATLDPSRVRLRASALQGDLSLLRPDLTCSIVPMALAPTERLAARMALAVEADPVRRTQDLIAWPNPGGPSPDWARAGRAALLEVELAGGDAELAIPRDATIRDGLVTVLYRRDRDDPDQVVRMEADLGVSDGSWVQVLSGLREGDEVVVDGISQLVLAGAARPQLGGHFHADGTFHADGDGKH